MPILQNDGFMCDRRKSVICVRDAGRHPGQNLKNTSLKSNSITHQKANPVNR